MQKRKKLERIIKKISLDYRIPMVDVEEMINYQFSFVRKIIESAKHDEEETFKTIGLPLFGKFLVKNNKINHIIKKKNGTKDNESDLE